MRAQVVLLLALLSPAGSVLAQVPDHSRPPHSTAPALDPVGTYNLDLDMHGQVTVSVLIITRETDGTLRGTLDVHGQSITFEAVSAINRIVRLRSGSELTVTLTFSNDNTLTGKWTRPEDSGSLTGIRRER